MSINGKETLLGWLLPPHGHLPRVLLQHIDEELEGSSLALSRVEVSQDLQDEPPKEKPHAGSPAHPRLPQFPQLSLGWGGKGCAEPSTVSRAWCHPSSPTPQPHSGLPRLTTALTTATSCLTAPA